MHFDGKSREEKYYNHFYETGEYTVRMKTNLTTEQKYLKKKLEEYNPQNNKYCLEVGSGGGSFAGYYKELYRIGFSRIC